ncbi:MAG: response regulator transcription factor [Proteobacteria bacterium]|nr:response regulator transcription factor [Pseudomonadota bacterium]MBU4384760.1 response regulator transcription factor [Pseudomonadota bacterium]MCG2764070.1 response regulator transcription factor [Desulfarculaceae bacterium]
MRLLVIEDYAPLRKAVVRALQEAGYAVDATGEGQEGLWYAQSNDYDLVVLDLMLPGLDGWSILRSLRGEGIQTHVLILTARDAVEDRVEGLDLGADDYLVKPFALDELMARVRALLRRQYQSKSPLIKVADLELNQATRQVRRSGQEIDLTRREYALLEYLALRAREVVSRNEIWEHLYEFNSQAQSNVVDVYIGYLRKKLDRPGLVPLIHTRRGQGYWLGEEDS